MAGGLARGDVRLYRFSPPDKLRPVVVLTREQALGYLTKVTVAPISSTVHDVPSEVVLDESDGMKGLCAVNLFNVMTLSSDLIGRRVAQLSPQRMAEICTALNFALGCDAQTGE